MDISHGEFKRRIDREDITEFWENVDEEIQYGCGIYIFAIQTDAREKVWYVGQAKNQPFIKECFTDHKIRHYHDALEKNRGDPVMYFVARMRTKSKISSYTKAKNGYPEMDFVENMFIELGYNQNKDLRNKKGKKNAERLIIEGFYNSKDRRRTPTNLLYDLLVGE